ncbi:chromosome partitioning protein [Halogranum rubrum]|uniref:Chromosome partitioning protein n=1 Tax=Halogranum rubrum TaxID=553466 RepID=A0A1I4EUZ2_9EURY|nr:ParA family protein [Halogranum rubrum]SFL09023.1 chromosome partitioning protein [Halogranum rubrum]
MTVITIWSESGGVGKTTTTLNLAAALGEQGKDVLIIDLDPQPASITDHAGYQDAKNGDVEVTLSDVLLDDDVGLSEVIIEDELFDLAPAHESLASLETTVRAQQISTAEFLLRSKLAEIEDEYDYILIDPPATLNLLVDNALIASGNVLVPMEMTRKGERSIGGVVETVTAIESQLQRAQPDFSLNVIGVLPNKVDGSILNQEIQGSLEDVDGVEVLPITIPSYNVMEQAWDAHLDIFRYAEHDDYGLRKYQESLLDAYRDLATLIIELDADDETEAVVS